MNMAATDVLDALWTFGIRGGPQRSSQRAGEDARSPLFADFPSPVVPSAALSYRAPGAEAVRAEDEMTGDPLEATAIAAVRGGDHDAYDYLVSKYMKRVLSIAWGMVRNAAEAEDLAQEAFVRAFDRIDRFRSGEPFGPWVYRIVTNLALDLLKHRRKFPPEPIDPDALDRQLQVAPVEWSDTAKRIDAALRDLPEMQGLVARLYLVEELGYPEIAMATGLAEGTIRSHLSHARRKLQEALSDLYGGDR